MKSLFEQMGGTYSQQGYYLIPNITLPKEENQPIGVWGQRHLRYLKQQRKVLYTNLLTSGKLNNHLAEIDKQAEELYFRLVKQFAESEGISEQLKADNPMKWVGIMGNIESRCREIVNSEVVFI